MKIKIIVFCTLLYSCINILNGQSYRALKDFGEKSNINVIGIKTFEHPIVYCYDITYFKLFYRWKEGYRIIMEKDSLKSVNRKNVVNLIYNKNYFQLSDQYFIDIFFLSRKTSSDYAYYGPFKEEVLFKKEVILPIDSLYQDRIECYNRITISKKQSYIELKTKTFLVVLVNHVWYDSLLPLYSTPGYSNEEVCNKHDKSYRDALYIQILIPLHEEVNNLNSTPKCNSE